MSINKTKKIIGKAKLLIQAGKATPAPPVGSTLGQRGANIMDFCKLFNDQTKSEDPDKIMRVMITFYHDKTFSIVVRQPQVSSLILKALKIDKGNSAPGITKGIPVKTSLLREVAKIKAQDMYVKDIDGAYSAVMGTARSMGLEVVDG